MTRFFYLAALLCAALALRWSDAHAWVGGDSPHHDAFKVGVLVLVLALLAGGVKLALDDRARQRTFRAAMLARLGQTHADVFRIRSLLIAPASREERSRLLDELVHVRERLDAVYDALPACTLGRRVMGIYECTDALRKQLRDVMDSAALAKR